MNSSNYNILKDFMNIEFSSFPIPNIPSKEEQGREYWDPSNTTYYNPICTLK